MASAWAWPLFIRSSQNTAAIANAKASKAKAAPSPSFCRWRNKPEMAPRPRILLVDDDERLRNAAAKVLTAEGYRVTRAACGHEALEILKKEPFALVVSDLRL